MKRYYQYTHTHLHTSTHTYTPTHTRAHTHTHKHKHTRTPMHTHTHSHSFNSQNGKSHLLPLEEALNKFSQLTLTVNEDKLRAPAYSRAPRRDVKILVRLQEVRKKEVVWLLAMYSVSLTP